jgi:hypothetical protein
MFRKLPSLLLLGLLAAAFPAAAQIEKPLYKLGLLLADDNKRNGGEVLNAATDAFVAAHRFTMVERKKLDAVFTEKDLQEFIGGKVNNKLSDVLGLDLVGIVDFTVDTKHKPGEEPETTWIIDVRMVDVKTSAIAATITSERASLLPAATTRDAGKLLFEGIREAFPPVGYVVQINGKEAIVDLGSEAGLKKGDALEIVQEGEAIIHPVTGQVLASPMKVIGELKVSSASPQLSTCKIKKVQGELRLGSLVRLQATSSVILEWLQKIPLIKDQVKKKKKEIKE